MSILGVPLARPEDERPFRAWLAQQSFGPSWPLDDIVRVATHGIQGDDDLALAWNGDALWERYYKEFTR